ncbi:hypothetical protein ACFL96_15855 [Thermoproteota archaeon]
MSYKLDYMALFYKKIKDEIPDELLKTVEKRRRFYQLFGAMR